MYSAQTLCTQRETPSSSPVVVPSRARDSADVMGVLAFGDSSTWATRATAVPAVVARVATVGAACVEGEDRRVGQVVSLRSTAAVASTPASGGAGHQPRSNPHFAPRSAWPGARRPPFPPPPVVSRGGSRMLWSRFRHPRLLLCFSLVVAAPLNPKP